MMLLEPCVPCSPRCGSAPFGAMSLTGDKHGLCPWLAAVKTGIRSHGEHPGICTCQTTQIAAVNEPFSGPITGRLSQYQFGGLFQTPHHGRQHGTRDEPPGLGSAGNRGGGHCPALTPTRCLVLSTPVTAEAVPHWDPKNGAGSATRQTPDTTTLIKTSAVQSYTPHKPTLTSSTSHPLRVCVNHSIIHSAGL